MYVGYVPASNDLGICCFVWRSEFSSKFLFVTEEKSTFRREAPDLPKHNKFWEIMTTVRVNDSNRADDDASAPVPHSPVQWWWQRWCGRSCTSTTATGRAMMPWHHHLSLACPRDGDGSGSVGCLCALTTATGQAMMPWHHHLYLARPRDGNGDGGGSGGVDARAP